MKHLKLFFACLLMAVLSIGQMWGETYTLGWGTASGTAGTYTNFTAKNGSVSNIVSFDCAQNQGTTAPTYNSNNNDLRLYYHSGGNGGSITLTPAANVTITGAVLTSSTSPSVKYSVNGGTATSVTASNNTYTVSGISATSSLTFQNVNTSNTQLRIKTIQITYSISGSTKPSVSLDPDGGNFTESVEVTITPSTGATAYYTTDATKKTTPSTTTWTAYNGSAKPTFTETTTIWVAAVKDATWSDVVEKTFTKVTPVTSYDIDFETNDLSLYVNWDFTNIGIRSTIARHGGDYYGANVNSGGNGVQTASITTKAKYAAPGILTFYISKESNNTTASYWKAQVSSNGTDWTDVQQFDAHSSAMNSGAKWNECTADLSAYTNVYVRISYGSSGAIRAIDDISLEAASNVAKPSITGEDNFLTSTEVTMSCTTDGAAIYYTTTESAKTTPATSGDWNAYDNSNKPSFSSTTTVWAAAKLGDDWSEVAEKTFTKATILTVAEALTIIEGLDNKTATTAEYYVSGVVSTVTALTVDGTGEYYISADGTKTSELQVYKGKWVGGANFTSTDQLIEGDDVTIKGKLKKYNSYKELDQNNEVVLYKLKARLAWSEESYEADLSSSNTYPSLTNTNGVSVSYSSSNTDAATINPSTGAISLVAVGSTTIKATFTGNETYKANEVSYTLNVSNSVIRADISFEENGGSDVADLTEQSNLPDPLPTITKAGYNFGGWWTTSDFQDGTEAVAGDAVTSTDPITLYAKWLNPYTVTEALTMIDALADNGETGNVYVFGIVCTAPSNLISGGYLTYYISVDGTETNRLQVYKGKNVGNIAFTDKEDVQAADQVIVYGPLKKFKQGENIIPEFNTGNYLYSLSRKAEAGIEWGVASFDAYIGESNTFPTLTNPNSLTVAYSSTNTTAATIDPATGDITLGTTPNVSTTIKATFAGNAGYKEAEVSYTLNVYNPTNPGTITYEENGGSEVADVTTPVDNFPDPLPEPTKENYIFAGWWTTSTFNDGTQAVAGAPMDGNVILYAKWTEIPVWAYTYTSNVTLSGAKVKFYGESTEYDAVKAGTGSAAGSTSITVPAQATKLHFHAYGWKGETVGLTVTAPAGVTVTPSSEISINSNTGMTSNSPFTLAEGSTPMTDAYYVVELSGNTEETTLTFSATSGKRFVLFGVNQEGGVEPELDHITITGELTNKDYELGDELDKTGLTVTAYYTLAGAAHHDEDVTSDVVWSNDPLTGGQTSVDVTATYGGKSDTKACAINAVVVPTPEIILSESALEFSGKQYGAVANKTFNVTLKNVAAATVALSGDDAAKFSVDPTALTANGTVTVSVANAAVAGSFSATVTVSDNASAATAQTVALTLTLTADEAPAWNTEWIEATELYDGMPILITGMQNAATYAIGAQGENNRAAVLASVNAQGVLTPGAGTKQFTLVVVDAENHKYAIKTSDGQYLYAASSTKNYLRSHATLDDDATWTLTTTSAVANGTNTHNQLKFNATNNPKIFSCYDGGQTAIKLYTPKTYERNVSGNYGTICLPKAGVMTNGVLYEISYYDADQKKIFFDEVEGGVMVAGAPYIFKPNENVTELKVAYTDATVVENAGHKNGLYGHYDLDYPAEGAEAARMYLTSGDYFLRNNEYWKVDQENRVYVDNYRAYIKLDKIGNDVQPQAYGRRRVAMNVNGEQVATGFENLNASEKPVKLLIDGNIFILRGEKLYDATGRLVK